MTSTTADSDKLFVKYQPVQGILLHLDGWMENVLMKILMASKTKFETKLYVDKKKILGISIRI